MRRLWSTAIERQNLVLREEREDGDRNSAIRRLQRLDPVLADQAPYAGNASLDVTALVIGNRDLERRSADRGDLLGRELSAAAHYFAVECARARHGQKHAVLEGHAACIVRARGKELLDGRVGRRALPWSCRPRAANYWCREQGDNCGRG